MSNFKLVVDEEGLPAQKIPKKARGKPLTFNVLDEMDEPEPEQIFTVEADLFDYGPINFKSISSLVSYVSQKGFSCQIYLEGKFHGFWSPEEGVTKVG